eukprot:CAMPEP_0183440546 /NCGR_PEP_ID=MMETSP0370-20130417/81852_1 /TAXON_ID=268820 /ORGANISM="Peridinium aciculiferum, Strain PAER-2" /LENGTH=511 /DNA_ID=CAMNT_0025629433 /DNA_START=66 /DNA_END=1601 /DNA_ORIENTATION=+
MAAVEKFSSEYEPMVGKMRAAFDAGKTKDIAWRRRQLEGIHRMMVENHEAVTDATRKDLGGGKLRGLGEVSPGAAADQALAHLDDWTDEKWISGWISRCYTRPEPKGVVLIIAPWNFPFNLALMPLIPAIAAGNCVIIKPSEMNPTCAPLLQALVEKYLDSECIKVVQGALDETTALLKQRWDHIFYTGNGVVGRIVMRAAAEHLTPVTLELGGKSPVIIDETAQMDATCDRVSLVKWMNCGQICVAPDYVLVHESRAKEFVDRQKALVLKSFGDDPKACGEYGKIVNERHVDRVQKLIETAKGELICGGVAGIDRSARHIPPTIIYEPSMDSPLMQEEIFGPIMPIVPYKTLDDAIKIVNSKDMPLAFYMYSENSANIEKVLSNVSSGGACVNTSLEHILEEDAPFGGKGPSGMGSYHGKFGFDELSHTRTILRKSTLPGFRGAAFPLPIAAKPTPDFVYGIAVKMTLGVMPRGLKAFLRQHWVKRSFKLLLLAVAVGALASHGIPPWFL